MPNVLVVWEKNFREGILLVGNCLGEEEVILLGWEIFFREGILLVGIFLLQISRRREMVALVGWIIFLQKKKEMFVY